jgi:beta-lactamase regulating signal transducer with metallopeptidase domain
VIIYLGIAAVLMFRLMWGLAMALRLWATADLVSPLTAPEPNVRSSAKVLSPVTIGSGIVLPASYIEWDHRKLRMVLAHERSHVRQLDFYLQLLAGFYTALFWFSPLGWWLRRTLASLSEAIGDRAGMDAAASRSRYAEVLLEFAAMPRQTLPGVAMARPGNLSHRVERLLNEHLFRTADPSRRAVCGDGADSCSRSFCANGAATTSTSSCACSGCGTGPAR